MDARLLNISLGESSLQDRETITFEEFLILIEKEIKKHCWNESRRLGCDISKDGGLYWMRVYFPKLLEEWKGRIVNLPDDNILTYILENPQLLLCRLSYISPLARLAF